MSLRWAIPNFRLPVAAASVFGGVGAVCAQSTNLISEEILPLEPPLKEIPPTLWEQHAPILVVCAILLIGLVCVLLWYLLRPVSPVPVPPEAQARKELTPLVPVTESGVVLSQVSQILRRYTCAAFELGTEEQTTTDFCATIQANDRIGAELAAALDDFMRTCDKRKFSPSEPMPPLGAAHRALSLVELAEQRRAALRAEESKTAQAT